MKRAFIITASFCLLMGLRSVATAVDSSTGQLNLLPVPEKVIRSQGRFTLDETFRISVRGNPDSRIFVYTTNFLRRLSGRTGLFFPQDFITSVSDTVEADLFMSITKPGENRLGVDESYLLKVKKDKIELTAETDIGAMRGLETVLQLLDADKSGYFFPGVEIMDHPRFPWRGLLIDVSRHFMPVEVIKRNLDAMAAVKMNVLHWHLVDDQGFRVESKTFPKLHQMGSDGYYYSQEQIKDIIRYADARGIRVLPEFDVPAHATSWLVGYPELASAPGPYTIERGWGVKDPTMNPVKEYTYEFLDQFFSEIARLFPDEYLHIGGDENKGTQWNNNPEIQAFMKENELPDNHALQTYFNQRILGILTKHGKKMIGWDEILQPALPKNVVIHSWRGHKTLVAAARQGYQGILSRDYYVDLMKTAEYHYLNDPVPADSQLTPEQEASILGGEATSWAELVTHETIDARIWPRTAAIAERLWSPQTVRDVEDMYRRLPEISRQLEETGVTHLKNYEMMLRRLANGYDIEPVKTFVDLLRQVENYQRHFQGKKYTSYSPLTRTVDAARSESMTARHFNALAGRFLEEKKKEDLAELIKWLAKWRDNHALLVPVMEQSPILMEMETFSADLKDLAGLGLEALDLIVKNKKPGKVWVGKCREIIDQARKPRGQAELMIVDGIAKLVENWCKSGEKVENK